MTHAVEMAHVVATAAELDSFRPVTGQFGYVEKVHRYTVTTRIGDHVNSRTAYTGTYPQLRQHVTAVGKRWHDTFGFPLVVTFDQVA